MLDVGTAPERSVSCGTKAGYLLSRRRDWRTASIFVEATCLTLTRVVTDLSGIRHRALASFVLQKPHSVDLAPDGKALPHRLK